MVSLNAPWIAPHDDLYTRMLERVRKRPPTGMEAFLNGEAYELLDEILDPTCYVASQTGEASEVKQGDPVLYFDGERLGLRPYDARERRLGLFFRIAERISQLAATFGREPLIVDLGAGTCIQAIVLRATGFKAPVLNLDLSTTALDIGRALCSALRLEGIAFAGADMSQPDLSHLAPVKDFAAGRPIIVISRYAIYPFYSAPEYERLFDYLIREVGVAGGIHLERTGRFTPTFARIQAKSSIPFPIPNKHQGKNDDPMAHLIGRPDVRVVEHAEIWPHHVDRYFPRYLAWAATK